MLKYIAVTLVALVAIGLTIGDESRREDVSRAGADPLLNFSFADFTARNDDAVIETTLLETPTTQNESDAVAKALAAAKAHRAGQDVRITLRGMTAPNPEPTQAAATVEASASASDMWYVTGTRVNVRSGPGTGNAVVLQARFGDEALPLTDTGNDWIEIQMSNGETGWIFSKFLSDSAPG